MKRCEAALSTRSSRRVTTLLAGTVLLGAVVAGPVDAAGTEGARATYDRLLEPRYSAEPNAVPSGGFEWTQDVATWVLESGRISLQEPVLNGQLPGMVFTGDGRFLMEIPDTIERQQLARMSGRPVAADFAVAFTEMVLSTSGPLLAERFPNVRDGRYERHPIATKRREVELEKLRHDVAARVVNGLLTPDDSFLRVEMKTEEFGWLAFEYDELRREEIELGTLRQNWFTEIWVSLDSAADRQEDGRPSGDRDAQIDVQHVDLAVDLTGKKRSVRVGISGVNLLEVGCVATMEFVSNVDGPRSLQLHLSPTAKVEAVRNESGEELDFIRDHLGARTADLEKDVYDASLLVLLDRPLRRGERRSLTVEFMKLMANYAAGRAWYPDLPDNTGDRHTARLEVTLNPRQEVRAVGQLIEERSVDDFRVSVWTVEAPVRGVSFTWGRDFREEKLAVEGLPEVVSFGPQVSKGFGGNMIRRVADDVVESLDYIQWLLDSPLDLERIQLTGIAAAHGQAFEGFIHMGELTYASERPGATELFRAHETAHQWWGHEIGWKSYRDQWLSEALAEYTAMMFVEARAENGRKHFQEMLETYTGMVLGSLKGQFSKYGRPWSMRLDLSDRKRLGPIGIGYRAATAEIPAGYFVQVYTKGALVLHTLRSVLSSAGGGDDVFVGVLREFAKKHRGRDASTQDFIDTVNRVAPGDWTWFFDQWLFGTMIPTYLWSAEMPRGPDSDGQWIVRLGVEQRDVPVGYSMIVPVRVESGAAGDQTYFVHVTQPDETFPIAVPERPSKVVFNPDHSVLARVKRR